MYCDKEIHFEKHLVDLVKSFTDHTEYLGQDIEEIFSNIKTQN